MYANGTPPRGADTEDSTPIGVIVADPDPLARRLIVETLRGGRLTIVAEARDGVEALELAKYYRPDIVLTEARLPQLDGVELTRRLLAEAPHVRTVVLTVEPDDELAMRALRNGARGVLSKQIESAGLLRALAGVHAGEAAISRELTTRLVERLRDMPEPGRGLRPVRSPLTTREWEVLDLLAGGASTGAIADTLVLSDETVISHIKHIRRKLGVQSRADAVRVAEQMLVGVG